jgi:hypothetical protein
MKRNPLKWEKNLQTRRLIRGQMSKYLRNSHNSITTKITRSKMGKGTE